jgi:subfamily B ATP-binding cassette protein MsbA
VVLALLKGVFGYLAEFQIRWVGYRLISDLRADLYDRILGQSVGFFTRTTTGQLMSRVLGDIGRLQKITSTNFAEGIRLVFTILALVGLVFYISWSLSLFCLVGLPLLVYPVSRLSRRLKKTSTQSQARAADLSHLLSESITGHRIVKAFNMEAFESRRFRDALRRMFEVDVKSVRTVALTPAIMEFVGSLYLAALLFAAGTLIASRTITIASLVPFIFGLAMIFLSIKKISLMNNDLQQALGATSRIFEVLDAPREVVDAPDAEDLPPFSGRIEFDRVSFRYEKAGVLDDVDLTIRAGEMVALVGTSGAGKTTLVNLLPRFYDVTGGAIRIDGLDVRRATLRSLREQIALVTQETILFNDSVRNNIAYGNAAIPMERIAAAARAANAQEFVEALPEGYDTIVGERGGRLSAGQRQRITIARALLKNAPILILDEATSALDTESEALVQDALETLLQGRTSIVIAHRLSTIQRADRICVLSHGRIVESGTHAQLLAAGGHYARLHAIQFRSADADIPAPHTE